MMSERTGVAGRLELVHTGLVCRDMESASARLSEILGVHGSVEIGKTGPW